MLSTSTSRIGYVVKRYPRYSETFIVNEILAHEQAGADLSIFALRPPTDTHFQDCISRVRAPVHYLTSDKVKGDSLWAMISRVAAWSPSVWNRLAELPPSDAQTVYQGLELAVAVRQQGIKHLHAHFATSASEVALLAGAIARVPVTFTAHAKDIFHEEVDPELLRYKLQAADTVVTVSEFNLAYLRETFGDAASRVIRIYNGLDLQRFPFYAPDERPPRIVAVGRLVEKKGFDDLLLACRELQNRGIQFACEIIGSGELDANLRRKSAQLGLDASVVFRGSLPQGEVIQSVRQASVLAAPCIVGDDGNRDGLPTVLLEGMALGTPCVATDVTGIPEVIRHRETGILTEQHNVTQLTSAIEELLQSPELRTQLATAARSLIEREFNIHRNAAVLRERFGQARTPHYQLQEI
jgi:glycosyltransferase involved in cell wall biosynthesis